MAPGQEALWVPALLALSVGPVFLLVSAQAPLMQRWYAADPRAGEPWALYAASNLGSFAGLIAYPLAVEPVFSLSVQGWAWAAGSPCRCSWCITARRKGAHRVGSDRATPALGRAGDDAIVDIGDVAGVLHLIAGRTQPAHDHVEDREGPCIAHMKEVVDRGAADIHAHMTGSNGFKYFFLTCKGVVNF